MKKNMKKRRESFDLSPFFYSSRELMCIAGRDGYFKAVNKEMCRILEYSEAEFLAKPFAGFILSEDLEKVKQAVESAVEGFSIPEFEVRFVSKNKEIKCISWSYSCVGDLLYGSGRDVTENKLFQQTLMERKKNLKFILDNAPVALFVTDSDGVLLSSQGKALKKAGVSPNQNVGKNLFELYSDRPEVLEALKKALGGVESTITVKAGELVFESCFSPIVDDSSEVIGCIGVSVDVTEEALARETALQLQQNLIVQIAAKEKAANQASILKSNFLANMSHEIRTPLNGILGIVDLLLETSLTNQQREYVDIIYQSGQNLYGLISDILDFTKIESGKIELESVNFNVLIALKEVTDAAKFMAQNKGLDFSISIDAMQNEVLLGDLVRTKQLFYNLIHNAIKFTTQGSVCVYISLKYQSATQADLRFEVSDTGPGIDFETQSLLFKPFQQADSSTSRQFGGTGLGLSICKGIVQLMGGKIGVESNLGEGAVFWIQIPVSLGQAISIPSLHRRLEDYEKIQGRILLAEDNLNNQKIACRILENIGLQVEVVSSGKEALRTLEKEQYDLVLMDCHMPEMDGFTAARSIRGSSNKEVQKIPIIAVTADVLKGTKEKCLASGMNDYIAKPLRSQTLRAIVQKHLSGRLNEISEEAYETEKNSAGVIHMLTLERLESLNKDGKPDIIRELFQDYLESTPRRLTEIHQAIVKKDFERLQFVSHTLKSSSSSIGFLPMAQICESIEVAAEARQLGAIIENISRIDAVYSAGLKEFEAILAKRLA